MNIKVSNGESFTELHERTKSFLNEVLSKDVLQQRVSRALKGEKNSQSSIPEQVNMLCLTTEGLSLTLPDGEKNSRFTEPSIAENGTGASG